MSRSAINRESLHLPMRNAEGNTTWTMRSPHRADRRKNDGEQPVPADGSQLLLNRNVFLLCWGPGRDGRYGKECSGAPGREPLLHRITVMCVRVLTLCRLRRHGL